MEKRGVATGYSGRLDNNDLAGSAEVTPESRYLSHRTRKWSHREVKELAQVRKLGLRQSNSETLDEPQPLACSHVLPPGP